MDELGYQAQIQHLERELREQRQELWDVFAAAALASTPDNFDSETAAIRAVKIANQIMARRPK